MSISLNLGFALEHSLGHVTHAQNLKRFLESRPEILPTYVDLPYEGMTAAWAKLPGVRSNWPLQASLGAFLALRNQTQRLQGAFFHTQKTSLLSAGLMRRIPSIISQDATPILYDSLGAFYGHAPKTNLRIERLKKRAHQRAFGAARHLVAWSEWAKASLVADYGVSPDKVSVVSPGVDMERWGPAPPGGSAGPVRLLFVGGDFARKGGELLLRWARETQVKTPWELHLVTHDAAPETAHVVTHQGIRNNSPELVRLYQQSDLFVLPTLADCYSLVAMEAMACGLPVVTSRVGGIPDIVAHGQTGYLLEPGDYPRLAQSLDQLVDDTDLRRGMGQAALHRSQEAFDCRITMKRILDLMEEARP